MKNDENSKKSDSDIVSSSQSSDDSQSNYSQENDEGQDMLLQIDTLILE